MPAAVGLSLADLEEFDFRASTHGTERRSCCPLAACAGKRVDRAHQSLAVNVQTGAWICHRGGGSGLLAESRVAQRREAPSSRARARVALSRAFRVTRRPAAPQQASTPTDAPPPRWR